MVPYSNESSSTVEIDIGHFLQEKNVDATRSFLPATVYTSVLIAVGSFGNALTLLIYLRYLVKPSTKRLFILVLATCDFVSCVVLLPSLIAETYFSFTFTTYRLCKAMRFLFYFFPFASTLTLLLISVERYMKICHPLKHQVTLSFARRLLVIATVLLPAILATPAAILNGVSTVQTGARNVSGVACQIADEFKNTPYPLVYNIFLLSFTIFAALLITVIYSFIWKTTWRHIRFRKHTTSKGCRQNSRGGASECSDTINHRYFENKRRQYIIAVTRSKSEATRHEKREQNMKKVTQIMTAVTSVFIVSFLPNCILQILTAIIPDLFNTLNTTEKVVYQLFLRSFMISYSANPVVYGLMDEAYRKACKDLFRCKK